MLVALFFYSPSPMLLLIGIMALPSLRAAWNYDKNSPDAQRYHDISDTVRVEYAVLYLGLAAVLAMMTYHVHEGLAHAR
jgi:hypothetical protein